MLLIVAVLLPFRAFRSPTPMTYIPGEEPQPSNVRVNYIQDTEPALFIYRQRFRFPGAEEDSVRDGVMGLLDRAETTVHPHEETIPSLVGACILTIDSPSGDLGSLWLWCNDANASLEPLLQMQHPPKYQMTDRFGCQHQIWPVKSAEHIRDIQAALDAKPIFIADGHHRFAAGWNLATIQIRGSALRFRDHSSLSSALLIEQIESNARDGILLPPKSTDFYPKLLAGLVVYRRQNEPQKENVTPPVAQRPGVR
jgi:uncharacterized protein (DUF1015 family)